MENPCLHTVFFDNLLTDYALLAHIQNLGFQATRTMKENRLSKFPLKESKLMKKEKKRTFDYGFDYNEEILIFKWVDNKCRIFSLTQIFYMDITKT